MLELMNCGLCVNLARSWQEVVVARNGSGSEIANSSPGPADDPEMAGGWMAPGTSRELRSPLTSCLALTCRKA